MAFLGENMMSVKLQPLALVTLAFLGVSLVAPPAQAQSIDLELIIENLSDEEVIDADVVTDGAAPSAIEADQMLLKSSSRRVARPKVSTGPTVQGWMSREVGDAWAAGYRGQGARVTVLDDFTSASFYGGDLGTGSQSIRHGEWTRLQSSMIAPSATIASRDYLSGKTVPVARSGLNVINLSYAMFAVAGYTADQITWTPQESSVIGYANNGRAVIVKAAGNDAVAIGQGNAAGNTDYLNLSMVGGQSAIFVGALDKNGATDSKANLAAYSNFAGTDPVVQGQFLTVGVRGDLTALYGTSFAAPVVSGYAAVLGSKFTKATPTQIANRLLDSARTDTITGYDVSIHGQGEASITRALAPASIN
jgi:subtilisin family serine protease